MSTGFVDFGWGCHFFTTTTRSIPKSVESVYFSLLFSPNMSFRFSLHKSLLLLLLLQKKKKRNPVDRSSKSATTPRRPEKKKKKKKKKKRAPRDAETRETPHQSARPFSERTTTTTTTFLRLLLGKRKATERLRSYYSFGFCRKGSPRTFFLLVDDEGHEGRRVVRFSFRRRRRRRRRSRAFFVRSREGWGKLGARSIGSPFSVDQNSPARHDY